MAFRFRQFVIEDGLSSMKVGTDALLLGAWCDPGQAATILDIGTGCGILALMLAQKCNARIDAIDLHTPSVIQASDNFRNSPWGDRLHAVRSRLQDHRGGPYDLVVCNPPWFRNSLKSPEPVRSAARHDEELGFGELLSHTNHLCAPGGRFVVVIPFAERSAMTGEAVRHLFFLQRSLSVIPKPGKKPNRILLEFGYGIPGKSDEKTLILRGVDGRFSDDYLRLTEDYHLFPNEQQFD